jgi:hypothetical protein
MGTLMTNMKNMFNGAINEVKNLVTQSREEPAQNLPQEEPRPVKAAKEECIYDEMAQVVKEEI